MAFAPGCLCGGTAGRARSERPAALFLASGWSCQTTQNVLRHQRWTQNARTNRDLSKRSDKGLDRCSAFVTYNLTAAMISVAWKQPPDETEWRLFSTAHPSYSLKIPLILTIRQQRRASEAARKVGGYDKLVELERQRRYELAKARRKPI